MNNKNPVEELSAKFSANLNEALPDDDSSLGNLFSQED